MKNGKLYIGSTKNYKIRWAQHLSELRNNKHSNQHLQNSWNKYGEDNFRFEIVVEIPLADQFRKEQEYLNSLKPFGEAGYNILRSTFSEVVGTCVVKKTCQHCGNVFDTLNNRSITCDQCRAEKDSVFNDLCCHCTICSHKKECSTGAHDCPVFLQCFGCKYALNCDIPTELLETDLCFVDTVSEGYLNPDDFWECN